MVLVNIILGTAEQDASIGKPVEKINNINETSGKSILVVNCLCINNRNFIKFITCSFFIIQRSHRHNWSYDNTVMSIYFNVFSLK